MTNKLKNMILKRAEELSNIGMDIDGDIIKIFDKSYYVNLINEEVMEVK